MKTSLKSLCGFIVIVIIFSFIQSCKKSSSSDTPATQTLVVTTVGGTGSFSTPTGVAVDANGNIYVSNYGNHNIRKIISTGIVSTLAGTGVAGFTNGPGNTAQFFYPQQLCVDASSNVYVVGGHNNVYDRIRKVTPSGDVTALAGNGVTGFMDGAGSIAQFSNPFGVVADAQGNVFVTDADNNRIRKITSAGVVSTFAGTGVSGYADGAGNTAKFNAPAGITIDATGNLYVADVNNSRIRKITSTGVVSTVAGTGSVGFADGSAANAQFNYPIGIAADSQGNLYVGDANNNRIRKITTTGTVTTIAGTGISGFADGPAATAQFNLPCQIAVDALGNIYVADALNNRIRKISLQ